MSLLFIRLNTSNSLSFSAKKCRRQYHTFAVHTLFVLLLCTSQAHLSICNHHHHHNRHQANMQLGHLLTCSGQTLPEVCSTVSAGSICLFVCSFLLSSAICYMLQTIYSVLLYFVQNCGYI